MILRKVWYNIKFPFQTIFRYFWYRFYNSVKKVYWINLKMSIRIRTNPIKKLVNRKLLYSYSISFPQNSVEYVIT